MATTSWVIVIFDTDGEVSFAGTYDADKPGFQACPESKLCAFQTSLSVSFLVSQSLVKLCTSAGG
jgi:hypothetical protein